MQFSKLVAGTEYLANRSNSWREYGSGSRRVRLDDTTKYRCFGGRYGTTASHVEDPKGDLVKVTVLNQETGEAATGRDGASESFVKPVELRGPWADALAERAKVQEQMKDQAFQREQTSSRAEARKDDLLARAKAEGLALFAEPIWNRTADGYHATTAYTYRLHDADLSAYLDRLDLAAADRDEIHIEVNE